MLIVCFVSKTKYIYDSWTESSSTNVDVVINIKKMNMLISEVKRFRNATVEI